MNKIFEPIKIKDLTLSNRIVMAPMVTFGYGVKDGFVPEEMIRHYHERALGGPGMIWVEASGVSKEDGFRGVQIGLWKDEHIEGQRRLTEAIHSAGVPCIAQLCHAGIEASTERGYTLGPSDWDGDLRGRYRKAKALDHEGIAEIKECFLSAADRAVKAGYDGIELHAAHSYLLSSFLSGIANKRNDEYGGDLSGRMRLLLELVKELKERYPSRIISVRMGGDTAEAVDIAKALDEAGTDIISCSTGFGTGGAMDEKKMEKAPEGFGFNIRIYGASRIKKNVSCLVMGTGAIRQPHQAEAVLEKGYADLVGVGRAFLTDPRFVEKIKTGEEIIECFNCPRCLWISDLHKCPGRSRYQIGRAHV